METSVILLKATGLSILCVIPMVLVVLAALALIEVLEEEGYEEESLASTNVLLEYLETKTVISGNLGRIHFRLFLLPRLDEKGH